MKKILVVFTGGTIGSMRQGTAIDVLSSGSYMILDHYKQAYGQDVIFETIQPLNMLSENMTSKHWFTLAESLNSVDYDQYEGMIITHGSDTLAYTAAMLSYLFLHIPIPLILIASNYPIGDKRSNGLRNFAHAVSWINKENIRGVFSIYEDQFGVPQVYLGSRMMQCESFTDQFRSPYDLTLGSIVDGQLKYIADPRNPSLEELSEAKSSVLKQLLEKGSLCSDIVYIKPYPGLKYSYYEWNSTNKPKAIVHDLYHSGTACAESDSEYSLVQFIKRCKEEGIQVYLCPIKLASEALYSSTAQLESAGAILTEGISVEALITKLMIGNSLFEEPEAVQAFVIESNLYYEYHLH